MKDKSNQQPEVAIVDYGMGNLFSVKMACQKIGLNAEITSSKKEISLAKGVILPGVGAFGDAMESLRNLDLIQTLKEAAIKKPFMGICLGMQLLMDESEEFGRHEGLGIVKGSVVRFQGLFKVPQVMWNRIYNNGKNPWENSFLSGLPDKEFMYFVHSFYPKPEDKNIVLSLSRYGDTEFCSSFQSGKLFACQFHPERSGPKGLEIYKNFKKLI